MVTKRIPGAQKGRPKKTKTEVPKRAKGRPAKPISGDSERYLKAFIQAHIDHQEFMESQGLISEKTSANKLAEGLIGLRYGRLLEGGRYIQTKDGGTAEENLSAMMNGKAFYVYAEPQNGSAIYRSVESGNNHRDGNTFRPTTHNVLKDLRLTRNAPPDDASRRWLAAMSMIWKACFQGDISFSSSAERLADAIGEREYFQAVMKPVMIAHATMRDAGFQGACRRLHMPTPPFHRSTHFIRKIISLINANDSGKRARDMIETPFYNGQVHAQPGELAGNRAADVMQDPRFDRRAAILLCDETVKSRLGPAEPAWCSLTRTEHKTRSREPRQAFDDFQGLWR